MNRAGSAEVRALLAGGVVGFEIAAKAAPDGYAILLGGGSALTQNPSLYIMPEAFSAYVREETAKYAKLIKQIGLKPE